MSRFDVPTAIRLTPFFANSVGWGAKITKVCQVLGYEYPTPGFPGPKEFVTAVHDWQRTHPPLMPDGVLGPKTWKKLGLVVAAYPDSTTFKHPAGPEWITKASAKSNKAPAKPPAQAVTSFALKTGEDKLIEEMAKVAVRQKYDPYPAVAVSGAYALNAARLGSKSNWTGQPISGTLQVGQQWQGIGGPRVIVASGGRWRSHTFWPWSISRWPRTQTRSSRPSRPRRTWTAASGL